MEKNSNQFQREYAEFIEIAAHDLDAPLRKLSLLVDVINKKYSETQGEDVQPYITRINTCIHDMRSLIDGLTLLSSVTTSPLTIQVVDLEQVVSEVRQNTDLAAGNVVINSSSLPGLEGDPSQLRILFRNLIQNSLLFNTAEKKEICLESADITKDEIKQHGLKKDTTYSKIIISDNGIGFLQEDAEKIFRPFVRLHGKSEYPGKGLGLALCKKIVENHGGIIYAESNEKEGSRFTLILPNTLQ